MASGASKLYRGAYTGTGAQLDVKGLPFKPRSVKLTSSAGDEATWQESMAEGSMHKRTAAGTGSLASSNGITPLADGFRIGADGDLNVSGELVHFEVRD